MWFSLSTMTEKKLPDPKWFTLRGAEIYTGLSGRTIQRRADDGTLTKTYAAGAGSKRARLLILRESIDRWLESGMEHAPTMAVGMNGQEAKP